FAFSQLSQLNQIMKPICLLGHMRSITQVRFNRDGDLIFTCAKDPHPSIWFALNGERLGSLVGHNGAVWCVDCRWDSEKVLTGSADNSAKLWDTETGKCVLSVDTNSAVRSCGFDFAGTSAMLTTDKTMGYKCTILLYDIRQDPAGQPACQMLVPESKITSAVWGPLSRFLITGHENGDLCQMDVRAQKVIRTEKHHKGAINDIRMYKDGTMFVTASKDHTARLIDSYELQLFKTYKTERPVNSADISPLRPHVLLGGGQEAQDVTTSGAHVGKFDAKFFHTVYEEEFARVKGHFGPINSVGFTPDGRGFVTGGEDGFVRLHSFDNDYFDFEFE
uniref:Eukaryotic translation initiation factor 3 subunit I n=4 Tax=Macrostomum lignano TaxID=282301 RepID=A0A1I8I7U4_9PLAT